MPKQEKLSSEHHALIQRYLTWAYKSTKESYDRLERKSTQLLADGFILDHIRANTKSDILDPAFKVLVDEYIGYIHKKKAQPIDKAKHKYLQHHLAAVEAAIVKFLGSKVLTEIKKSYEVEFTRRIWESKEH